MFALGTKEKLNMSSEMFVFSDKNFHFMDKLQPGIHLKSLEFSFFFFP